jgi:hypothetical protein
MRQSITSGLTDENRFPVKHNDHKDWSFVLFYLVHTGTCHSPLFVCLSIFSLICLFSTSLIICFALWINYLLPCRSPSLFLCLSLSPSLSCSLSLSLSLSLSISLALSALSISLYLSLALFSVCFSLSRSLSLSLLRSQCTGAARYWPRPDRRRCGRGGVCHIVFDYCSGKIPGQT